MSDTISADAVGAYDPAKPQIQFPPGWVRPWLQHRRLALVSNLLLPCPLPPSLSSPFLDITVSWKALGKRQPPETYLQPSFYSLSPSFSSPHHRQ